MRALPVLELDAEAPVHRAEAPEIGQHAVEARELHRRHLGQRLRGDERRREQLASEREHVLEAGVHACARVPARVEGDAERVAHRRPDVLGERHLGACLERRTDDPEALVRVDAPPAGRSDRDPALEGQPRRVGEQVPHGRAGRPGGIVEVEHALLGGDEHGERGDRLRDRGQSDGATNVAAGGDRRVRARDAGRGERGVPLVDLAQRLHAGRY